MEFLDPYRFNLHTTLGHHGHSINCGHYTASINCCEKIIPTIQESLNAISMIPTTHLLLYNVECLWQDRRGWELMHFWIRLCSYYVVVVVVVWGSIQRRWHSCLQQPSYVCTISPNSKLPLQTHTLVTRRTGADSPATYMIWMGMMTVIHKKSQLFFQIKSFGKRHLMKTPSNSLWFTNWISQQSISKHIKMSELVWFGIDSK